ncbi:MAG: HAD family hydrolase [Opitutales bacterium]|nr:HAD family hydrolase [Opitutales bacterium]
MMPAKARHLQRFREQAAAHPLEPLATDHPPHLPKLKGIRAVVFDIYGTLVISGSGDISLAEKNDRSAAFKEAFAAVGHPLADGAEGIPAQFFETVRAHQGRIRAERKIEFPEVEIREVWRDFLRELTERKRLPATLPADLIETLAIELECRLNPVAPMPGLAGELSRLQTAGLPLGIVSNAQFYTPIMLEAFLEKPLEAAGFLPDLRVYSFEEREGKPSTALYAKLAAALEKHDLAPGDVLYVGNDMRNDIGPAAALGFRTALFAGDARSLRLRKEDPALARLQPDLVLHQLQEIGRALG